MHVLTLSSSIEMNPSSSFVRSDALVGWAPCSPSAAHASREVSARCPGGARWPTSRAVQIREPP
eukprot:414874-Prymnesium_polylepis.2